MVRLEALGFVWPIENKGGVMKRHLWFSSLIFSAVLAAAFLASCGGESAAPAAKTYVVTYDGNGNTGGSVPVDTTRYQQGQTVAVRGNTGGLTNGVNVFDSWNTKPDATGTKFTQTDTFTMGSEDVTLYARWCTYQDVCGYQDVCTGTTCTTEYVCQSYYVCN